MEMGHTGTVFLDEGERNTPGHAGEAPAGYRGADLHPVGGTSPTSVDLRIIAATNRHLKEEVDQGRFRQDLFYRLNVIPLAIPALRERREDVPALALHFLERVAKARKLEKRLEPGVLEALQSYDYPGNVRELYNIIERMVVMSEGQFITMKDLPGIQEARGGSCPVFGRRPQHKTGG